MKANRVTAISRAVEYSPNCERNDALIFGEVCNGLQKKGFQTEIVCEADIDFIEKTNTKLYISMARGRRVLDILKKKENSGALVINSAKSLIKYNRIEITKKMIECGVPIPQSEITETGSTPGISHPFG